MNILAKIFGTKSDRDVKHMQTTIDAINALEPEMKAMTDEQLAAQTVKFRQQLKDGAKLEDLLVPAFATVREASYRVLGMRDFDVQLMGGIALTQGKIAEMKTGEGKTLVATLAVYLDALEGKGVHVVTVNDYLAKRDSEWMGKLYRALGMTTGNITHDMPDAERKKAYDADITYGTNNEYGFDYLRDNMKFRLEDKVQRGHHFAIIDEVDSILIDEARTPLIISGPSDEDTSIRSKIDAIIPQLVQGEELNADDPDLKTTTGDFIIDEKRKSATLTDDGMTHVEQLLGMNDVYDADHMQVMDQVQTAIRAHVLYQKDKDYIVRGEEIIIVDEFTGRLMPGRRWSDGLHSAIEAKEHVPVQPDNQTMATVTFQNYFRMYDKLAGMTGTAATEEAEFGNTYKMDVIQIPTNKPNLRHDFNDLVYRFEDEKFRAVAREIQAEQAKGQPVLVGTVSIEKSEKLSALLDKLGVKHQILNAKNVAIPEEASDKPDAKSSAREAAIIAQAGRKGMVTISTNMAGRGTDILLGGNPDFMAKDELVGNNTAQAVDPRSPVTEGPQPDGKTTVFSYGASLYAIPTDVLKQTVARYKVETDKEHDEVVALGGLSVIGTERHDSRRVDNQLRGRAGRQGDPGSSRFFISLEDHLARVWGGPKLQGILTALGMTEDSPIESKMVSGRIEKSQKKVEDQNFLARKNLLEYDDVMNMQRKIVYSMRDALMDGSDEKTEFLNMASDALANILDKRYPKDRHSSGVDWEALAADVKQEFGIDLALDKLETLDRKKTEAAINDQLEAVYDAKEKSFGAENLKQISRTIMLDVIDSYWKEHLYSIDYMKDGIGLRSYAQLDPLLEYKKEAFRMFTDLMAGIADEASRAVFSTRLATQEEMAAMQATQQIPGVANQFSAAAQTAETRPEAPKPANDSVAAPASVNTAPKPAAPPGM